MKHIYTDLDKTMVIEKIQNHIDQTSDSNTKNNYMQELENVKSNWDVLVDSKIFNDAIGEVVNKEYHGGWLAVEVASEN